MGFWSKLTGGKQGEQKDYTLADPALLSLFGVPATASGIFVGESSAMRQPTSGAAIRLLSGILQTTRCHCYRRSEDGSRERASDHPAEKLLSGFANGWLPAPEFRRQAMFEAVNHGRSFALISKLRGVPREILPLPRSAVVRETSDLGEPRYHVTLKSGERRTYSSNEILEVAPWSGRSLTGDASEAIARCVALGDHASKLFRNNARPGGVLKIPGKLTEVAAKRIREAWESSFGGENSGKTAVLEENATWEAVTMSAVDSEYTATLKACQEDVARCYSVPLTLLNHLDRAVWKNPEQLAQEFLEFTILPILQHWEGALTRCLLSEAEREEYFIEFDTNAFAKADLASRFSAYAQARTSAIFTANEVRRLENMPPHADGDRLENPAISPGPAPAKPDKESDDDDAEAAN